MSINRRHLNPTGVPDWSQFFSQAVVVEANGLRTIFVSGQVGVDEYQTLWADGSLSTQASRALHNLSIVLKSANADLTHVTKLTVFVANYTPEDSPGITSAIREHFPLDRLPALSLIGVQALARPEFRVEVEAVAVNSIGEQGPPNQSMHSDQAASGLAGDFQS